MLKKTFTWTDFDGNERTEDFYFNLNKAEAMEWELSYDGGLIKHIERIVAAKDGPELGALFKKLILKTYGVKSPDGKRFIKSEELSKEFEQMEPYSILFMELSTSAEAAEIFINGVVPQQD